MNQIKRSTPIPASLNIPCRVDVVEPVEAGIPLAVDRRLRASTEFQNIVDATEYVRELRMHINLCPDLCEIWLSARHGTRLVHFKSISG